jgi:hypothetical protein
MHGVSVSSCGWGEVPAMSFRIYGGITAVAIELICGFLQYLSVPLARTFEVRVHIVHLHVWILRHTRLGYFGAATKISKPLAPIAGT